MGIQESLKIELPSSEEVQQATESRRQMVALLPQGKEAHLFFKDGEVEITLPTSVLPLLAQILDQISLGNAVSIVPIQAELTTQQAADFLNVSRPYLVKLLENGAIPHRRVGVRRRVMFRDLLEYREKSEQNSRKALEELACQAQDLNMGY